jgi:hypothetical protein
MTNTVFPTFQTQCILDFSSASRSGTLGFAQQNEVTQILKGRYGFGKFVILCWTNTLFGADLKNFQLHCPKNLGMQKSICPGELFRCM